MNRPDTHTVVWLLGLAIVIGLSQPASALRKNQPWGVTTRADPDTHAGGWFINLGITGARAKILRDAPRILEVTYVVWYKDGGRSKPSYADMGRTGASALAHYLSPIGGRAYSDFAKLNANCIGSHRAQKRVESGTCKSRQLVRTTSNRRSLRTGEGLLGYRHAAGDTAPAAACGLRPTN